MNILTLSIKQKYFDEILAGKKTHEYREIRPTNAKKYITYLCGGKEYPADAELPEEGEAELKPIKYDAIKLLTGAYTGKRPYIIVEVKNAEAVILTDENGKDIADLEDHKLIVASDDEVFQVVEHFVCLEMRKVCFQLTQKECKFKIR